MKNIFFYETQNDNWYHLPFFIFLIITIVAAFFFLKYTKSHDDKKIKITVFVFGLAFLLIEGYKQIFINIIKDRDSYSWSQFPFQLCSTPLYLCLTILLFKPKAQDFIYTYLGSYAFLGGFSVLAYPESVKSNNCFMMFCSLIWHALMVMLGLYLMMHKKFGQNFKQFRNATFIFVGVVTLAMIMNITFEQLKGIFNIDSSFNMLYISPYYESHIVIMKDIWRLTNWFVFFLIYVLGIPFCAFIVWKCNDLVKLLKDKVDEKRQCHM